MCIITNNPKGVAVPDSATIKQCWASNPHGAGVMYSTGTEVVIKKGFMTLEEFEKEIAEIENPTERGIVYHFRITSHGGTNQQNTHPFPISGDIEDLKLLELTTDIGFAHNGIISLTSNDMDIHKYGISDTMVFIEKYVSKIFKLSNRKLKQEVLDLVDDLGKSKFSLINPKGEIFELGFFIEEKETGLSFSNSSYKPYVPKVYNYTYGGKTYSYGTDGEKYYKNDCISDEDFEEVDFDYFGEIVDSSAFFVTNKGKFNTALMLLELETINVTKTDINATIDMYEGYTKDILLKDLADTLDKTLSTSILKLVSKLTKTEILVLITKALASWDVMYGS